MLGKLNMVGKLMYGCIDQRIIVCKVLIMYNYFLFFRMIEAIYLLAVFFRKK